MKPALAVTVAVAALLCACSFDVRMQPEETPSGAAMASLPVALSNNAVALVRSAEGFELYSFGGLVGGKSWRDVSDRAFVYESRHNRWSEIAPIPGGNGRLAATAATVAGQVYVFGGYTVAEDGSEVSTHELFRLDPQTRRYTRLADMPVPVDDTVSAVYQDRFIYLVSGWHQDDNVEAVQLYDTQTRTWLGATAFPGRPVFGHAGGISQSSLVVCDGVTVRPPQAPGGRRSFAATNACYRGTIDPVDPTRIDWQRIQPHPGKALYRAAAAGLEQEVIFAGGSTNPYNYDGVGYDGVPAPASDAVWRYSPGTGRWSPGRPLEPASMDHRGLAVFGQIGLIVGGMDGQRRLRRSVSLLDLSRP